MDDYTSCLLQGYGIVPSAPRRLRVSNVDVNFAIFHWESPKDLADTVTHYNVFYRLIDDEYDSIVNVHSPFILEHLKPNTLYEVFVEAVNGHGAGEPSQRVVFSTKSQVFFYIGNSQNNILFPNRKGMHIILHTRRCNIKYRTKYNNEPFKFK